MKTRLLGSIAAIALAAGSAAAADRPVKAPIYQPPPIAWDWAGFYLGVHVGGGLGLTRFSDPFGASIYGDKVRTPAFLGGGQVGNNWQLTTLPLIFGLEADLSGLDAIGDNTCLAYSGLYVSANCRVKQDTTTTLAARLGYAVGPGGHTLLYLKGGLAGVHTKTDIAANVDSRFAVASQSAWRWGGMVGAGIEQAMTPAWSLKLEYDYLGFGGHSFATPASEEQEELGAGFSSAAGSTTTARQQVHQFKLGLNYRIGADPWSRWPLAPAPYAVKAPPALSAFAGWEIAGGVRYWYSSGRLQSDLGTSTDPAHANTLKSRLVYASTANSGEFFGRIETPWSIFVKGFVGAGRLAGGHMNDEDWRIPGEQGKSSPFAYSNTISDPLKGTIGYATIDAGYDVFRSTQSKLGGFIGYNYYKDNEDAYGCLQLANQMGECTPDPTPNSTEIISEHDIWQSLRLGLNGEITLLPGLKLSADAAYLPYVTYKALDVHYQRLEEPSLSSPGRGTGRGVQLETILSYDITSAFNVGIGGRYWAMWTDDDANSNLFNRPCPCLVIPSKVERYGVFFQAAYQFGTAAPVPVMAKY